MRGTPGTSPVLDTAREGLDDRGYLMVVLLIGMAVTAIWMGSLLPAWHQQAQREREQELIFRGEQYARAIALYYRKNDGRLPASVDVLLSGRYLRKKWKDPITGEDFATVSGITGGQTGQPGASPAGQAGNGGARGAAPVRGGTAQAPAASAGSFSGGGQVVVSGVRSTSNDTSIVIYRNQSTYSLFPFDYTAALQLMGVNPNQGGNAGNGRGGRGATDEGPAGRGGLGNGGAGGGPARPGGQAGPGRGGNAGPPTIQRGGQAPPAGGGGGGGGRR